MSEVLVGKLLVLTVAFPVVRIDWSVIQTQVTGHASLVPGHSFAPDSDGG